MSLLDDPEPGKFGRQVGRMYNVVACLLDGHGSGLGNIPFDKLAVVAHRFWNDAKKADHTSFLFPGQLTPGKHGPGVTLGRKQDVDDRREHIYFTELVEIIQKHLPGGAARYKISRKEKNQLATVCSGLVHLQAENLLTKSTFLEDKDRTSINFLSELMSRLNANQIRVLGVHCNLQQTITAIKAVEKGIRRYWNKALECGLRYYDLCDPTVQLTESLQNATEAQEWALEMGRKCTSHEPIYKQAHKVLQDLPESFLKDVMMQIYQPADSIWGEQDLLNFRERSEAANWLSAYILAVVSICFWNAHGKKRLNKHDQSTITNGNKGLTELNRDWHYAHLDLPTLDLSADPERAVFEKLKQAVSIFGPAASPATAGLVP